MIPLVVHHILCGLLAIYRGLCAARGSVGPPEVGRCSRPALVRIGYRWPVDVL